MEGVDEKAPQQPGLDVAKILSQVGALCKAPFAAWEEIREQALPSQVVMKRFYLPLLVTAHLAAMVGALSKAFLFPLILFTAAQIGVGYIMPTLYAVALSKVGPKLGAEVEVEELKKLLMFAFLPSLAFQILTIFQPLTSAVFVFGLFGSIISLVAFYGGVKATPSVPDNRKIGFYVVSLIALVVLGLLVWIPLMAILPSPFPIPEIPGMGG